MHHATVEPEAGSRLSTTHPRKKRRVFLWVFLAVQVLMLIWMVTGINSGSSGHCTGGISAQDCANAKQVGTAIGAGVILAVWAAVDIILGFGYLIYRLARR